jgi:magnesium chelatase family protein
MARARTYSVVLTGVTGHLVEIETDIADGPPGMILAGLPDTALREARDRIRAAVVNSGVPWPQQRITVGLFPASLPRHGSGCDTAIAAGILAAAGLVPADALHGKVFTAELGLDGRIRPVNGVLPSVLAAQAAGFSTVVVAEQNAAEAAQVPGMTVISATSLAMLISWLRAEMSLPCGPVPGSEPDRSGDPGLPAGRKDDTGPDLAQVLGQSMARKALEICAAGGHHLSLLGPPGAGKTMLAERLPTILPPLDRAAALDVTSIHSVAGMLPSEVPLLTEPPFLAPHHTASKAAIVGGGTGSVRPGAASLAHRGVLFLDEAPEFDRDVLDALRQPLEDGRITLARSGMTTTFPARFTLILAANPCPCAKVAGPAEGCSCSPATRRRYLGKLSGPLMDRVDVKVELLPVGRKELLSDRGMAESSQAVAMRVTAARERAAHRLRDTQWRLNAEVPGSELRCHWPPGRGALAHVERALERGLISARGVIKVIRVGWTIADLLGKGQPGADECDAALSFWLGVTR